MKNSAPENRAHPLRGNLWRAKNEIISTNNMIHRTIWTGMRGVALIAASLAATVSAAQVKTATFDSPDLDQWAYHRLSGSQAGSWGDAALFTKREVAGGEEDRAALYYAAYDISASIPAGLGASSYQVHSARVIAEVVEVNGGAVYDPTYDSWRTHLLPTDVNYAADHISDGDPGRPISLFGLGLTNGFERFSFDPNGGLAANAPLYNEFNNPMVQTAAPFGRNAFPFSYDSEGNVFAVNNNVYEGVEANPWAVASIAGKNPGEVFSVGDTLVFDLNVTDRNIQGWLRQALDAGQLGLVLSSLHQTDTDGFMRLASNETLDKHGASLVVSYSTVENMPLQLLSLRFENQQPVLRFTGRAGERFEIQRSPNLMDWEAERDPVLTYAESGIVEWTDTHAAGERQFYRVFLVTP